MITTASQKRTRRTQTHENAVRGSNRGDSVSDVFQAVYARESEKSFMARVVHAAELYGWLAFHQLDSRGSAPGWPDLVLMRPPRMLYLECKRERGVISGAQQRCLAALQACGQAAYVVRPSMMDEILELLR